MLATAGKSYHIMATAVTLLQVQTQPKPSDFSGEKILSMPSFGGEVKPSVKMS